MAYVFISHAHTDRDLAERVATRIRSVGPRVYCSSEPEDRAPGVSIPDELTTALDQCTHFVLIASPQGLASEWVQREIGAALMRGHAPAFISLLMARAPMHLPALLRQYRAIDYQDESAGWIELSRSLTVSTFGADAHGQPVEPLHGLAGIFEQPAALVLELLLKTSKNGTEHDPYFDSEEIMSGLSLSANDLLDAVSELDALGLIHRRPSANSPIGLVGISADARCFASYDEYVQPWNPSRDAEVIADRMLNDPSQAVFPRKVAAELGWPLRRVNPAITFLIEEGAAEPSKHVMGDGAVIASYARATQSTRRWLRDRR